MENVVSQLSTGVTPATLWGQIGTMMPFIITMTLFGFGYYIFKKVIRGTRTGRAKS